MFPWSIMLMNYFDKYEIVNTWTIIVKEITSSNEPYFSNSSLQTEEETLKIMYVLLKLKVWVYYIYLCVIHCIYAYIHIQISLRTIIVRWPWFKMNVAIVTPLLSLFKRREFAYMQELNIFSNWHLSDRVSGF